MVSSDATRQPAPPSLTITFEVRASCGGGAGVDGRSGFDQVILDFDLRSGSKGGSGRLVRPPATGRPVVIGPRKDQGTAMYQPRPRRTRLATRRIVAPCSG